MELGLGIAYIALLGMALFPIYVGSYLSLNQKATETLSSQHAWSFPILGSGVLFGLYVLFKLVPKEYINLLLTLQFVFMGVGALSATLSPWLESLLPSQKKAVPFISFTPFWKSEKSPISFSRVDAISFIISVLLVAWYVWYKYWIANNIIGLAFCIQAISLISLGCYWNGCLLLSLLFFYDIFWVFGTDVMVTVAVSLDAPVKLLFPKDIFAEKLQYSMLGLGDIVIPGFLIAFLLRFDYTCVKNKAQSKRNKKATKSFSKPYFHSTFIAYILGLFTTISVMHIFKSPQPALLYLVPFCLGMSACTALVRGEFRTLWAYSEEGEEQSKDNQTNDNQETHTQTQLDSNEISPLPPSPQNQTSKTLNQQQKNKSPSPLPDSSTQTQKIQKQTSKNNKKSTPKEADSKTKQKSKK